MFRQFLYYVSWFYFELQFPKKIVPTTKFKNVCQDFASLKKCDRYGGKLIHEKEIIFVFGPFLLNTGEHTKNLIL